MNDLICGILHISSKISYGSDKKYIIKKFTSHYKYKDKYRKFYVKTKKKYQSNDIYCVIKCTGFNKIKDIPLGTVERYIGDVGNKQVEMNYIKILCTLNWKNNRKVNVNKYLTDYNKDKRIKITDRNIYSIDPPGCIDIDDALHIKEIKNNLYEIGIHIADPSSYILPNTDLDIELQKRCESVYLKEEKVNMLPTELVRLCSLSEDTEKPAYSIIMRIDNKLDILDVKFIHTNIKINKNFTYRNAYKKIKVNKDLLLLWKIGERFHSKLFKHQIEKEYNIHSMIEAYMILANTTVANYIASKVPDKILLRCHEGHRKELYNLNQFNDDISTIVEQSNKLLMKRAMYCIGVSDKSQHVGLNQNLYTHFTSPIRRYGDIIIHRMLDNINNNKKVNDISNEVIDQMNYVHKKYNRCGLLSNQMDMIFKIHKDHNDLLYVTGYIIYLELNRVNIYVEELDMMISTNIYSFKLKDLINTNIEKKDKIETLTLTNKILDKQITIQMFQKVSLKLVSVINSKRKLLVQIIEPNIGSIFGYCNDEYTDYSETDQ